MTDSSELSRAIEDALAGLWHDRDVERIWVDRQGGVRLRRRGKREDLAVRWPEELWQALDRSQPDEPRGDASTLTRVLDFAPHRAVLGLDGGRVTRFFLEKAPSLPGSIHELEEQDLCSQGLVAELVGALLAGESVLLLGVATFLVDRMVWSTADAASTHCEVVACTPPPPAWRLPAGAAGGDLWARGRAALTLGAEVLVATGLAADDLAQWMSEVPAAATLVGARVSSPAMLEEGGALAPLRHRFGRICVCAYDAAGRPRVVALAADRVAHPAPVPDLRPQAGASAPLAATPQGRPPPSTPRAEAPAPAWDALPPLEALPPGPPPAWTSHAPDDDPGWELAEVGRTGDVGSDDAEALGVGAFAQVLADVARRPSFTPKPPPPHPQARRLRADPFGGLTLEPPRDPVAPSRADDAAAPGDDGDPHSSGGQGA